MPTPAMMTSRRMATPHARERISSALQPALSHLPARGEWSDGWRDQGDGRYRRRIRSDWPRCDKGRKSCPSYHCWAMAMQAVGPRQYRQFGAVPYGYSFDMRRPEEMRLLRSGGR